MATTSTNFDIPRGDSRDIRVTVTDSETGDPLDLTGSTVFFTLKAEIDNDLADSSALIKKDVVSHTDPTAGKTTIRLLPSETGALTPGEKYPYDIQVKLSGGDVMTIVSGKIRITADVTRRTS